MECTQFRDEKLLDAYDELDVEPDGYREHVESCSGCRNDLEDFREISDQYRLASTECLPRLAPARKRRDHWIPAIAAALLIAVLVGVLVWPSRSVSVVSQAVPPTGLSSPLPAWDADDEAFDRELSELRRRLDRLEFEIRRRNS